MKAKVIFGIGNPGTRYANTRHNAGTIFLEWLLQQQKARGPINTPKYSQYTLSNGNLICISHTFMNLSGKAIESFRSKNPTLLPKDFLIVHDDLEHKLGNMRVKEGGSAQGHNGITSIAASLKTKDFLRLQVGIDRPTSRDPEVVAKYVLDGLAKSQLQTLKGNFPKGVALLRQFQFL